MSTQYSTVDKECNLTNEEISMIFDEYLYPVITDIKKTPDIFVSNQSSIVQKLATSDAQTKDIESSVYQIKKKLVNSDWFSPDYIKDIIHSIQTYIQTGKEMYLNASLNHLNKFIYQLEKYINQFEETIIQPYKSRFENKETHNVQYGKSVLKQILQSVKQSHSYLLSESQTR